MGKKRKLNINNNVVSFLPTGEYYHKRAVDALNRDRLEKALIYIKRALDLSPGDVGIIAQYAVIEMESGRFEHALDLLHIAHELEVEDPNVVFFIAEASAQVGLISDAKKYAQMYLKMDSLGEYSEDANDLIQFMDEEFSHVFDVVEDHNEELSHWQSKAQMYIEQSDFLAAILVLEQILEKYPDNWNAYNNLALCYFYTGDVEQAKALLHEVLRKNIGNLHALCNLVVVHYYEKNDEEIVYYLNVLNKIQPYNLEHRYKLGATFALVGRYEEAYKWLRSLQRKGFKGDTGFYFWLSHAAYFTNHEKVARQAWDELKLFAPDKEGLEPWAGQNKGVLLKGLENDRQFIIEKLESVHRSDRLFGLFLVSKTAHRQEIISHPDWIKVDSYSEMEKAILACVIDEDQSIKRLPKMYQGAIEATNYLYNQHYPLASGAAYLFQMWFVLMENALEEQYSFKNAKALAAAADFMFQSSREDGVTKKSIAANYGVSVATLTKYVSELFNYLPIFK